MTLYETVTIGPLKLRTLALVFSWAMLGGMFSIVLWGLLAGPNNATTVVVWTLIFGLVLLTMPIIATVHYSRHIVIRQ